MKFHNFNYTEVHIPLDSITFSISQPVARNNMDLPKRRKLLDSMNEDGLLTRVDVIEMADGTYELVDGHGRVSAARDLGWGRIAARVFQVETDAQRAELRAKIFECAKTVLGMSGSDQLNYIHKESQSGNENIGEAFDKARPTYDWLKANFSLSEVTAFIKKGINSSQLDTARFATRKIARLPLKGAFPDTQSVNDTLKKAFPWVVKHNVNRGPLGKFVNSKGAVKLEALINDDQPLPKTKRGKK